MDEAENQVNVFQHKEAKNNQSEQEEKRIQKNKDSKQPLGQLQAFQHSHHRDARREEKEQEIGNLFEKMVKENFPNLVKEIDIEVQE